MVRRAQERAARPAPPPPPRCAVRDCGELATARGWCGAHYQRWRRFGDPTFYPLSIDLTCTIEGCNRPRNARYLCGRHYYRWHRYGDPLFNKNAERETTVVLHPPRPCVACGQLFDPVDLPRGSTAAARPVLTVESTTAPPW